MKKWLSVLLTIALMLGMVTFSVNAAENDLSDNNAPSVPIEGDVWDGSILKPSKLVTKDGVTYYEITKCAELAYVAQNGGEWLTYNYILGNNLILNDVTFTWDEEGNLTNSEDEIGGLHKWTPINNYSGMFCGDGYKIIGLYTVQERGDAGLFASFCGDICDVTLENAYVNGNRAGIIAGYAGKVGGYIENCTVSGAVLGTAYAGGMLGQTYCQNLDSLVNYAEVFGSGEMTGGITGDFSAYELKNCENHGCVQGENNVGGIVGNSWIYRIENCVNTGRVDGNVNIGGIVGFGETPDIVSCVNLGWISGSENVGGIAGISWSESVGWHEIRDVYNLGAISGDVNIGGIIGKALYAPLCYAYNIASITATDGTEGAIIGNSDHFWGNRSTITNCYYAKDTGMNEDLYAFGNRSEDGTVAGDEINVAEAKTLAELKQQATFVNWDFTETWAIDPEVNDGYPYLSWQTFDDSPIAVNGISLDKSELTLGAGDYAYLTASISPATATDKSIKWTSDTPAVATVSASGKVEAISAGTAMITATSADGKHSAACTVTVNARAANEYELKKLSLRDSAGNQLSAIPKSSFWATVAVKNLASAGNSVVLLTTYDVDGRYLGMNAAWVEDVPVGSTVNISFLLSNNHGKIAEIRTFCVASFANLTPLGSCLAFPQ